MQFSFFSISEYPSFLHLISLISSLSSKRNVRRTATLWSSWHCNQIFTSSVSACHIRSEFLGVSIFYGRLLEFIYQNRAIHHHRGVQRVPIGWILELCFVHIFILVSGWHDWREQGGMRFCFELILWRMSYSPDMISFLCVSYRDNFPSTRYFMWQGSWRAVFV